MKRLLLLLSLSLTVLSGCMTTKNGTNDFATDDAPQSESNINKSTPDDTPKIVEREPVAKPATQSHAQPAAKPLTQAITEPITQPVAQPAAKPVEKTVEPSVAPQNSATSSSSMVVLENKTKLRKSPSSKSTVVKTLKKGEVVQLIKQKEGWSLVELAGGETGWCAKGTLAQKQ